MSPQPVPGPHDPATATPPRAPGSVRRTSSIDTTRPDGRAGPAFIDARARQVVTGADGGLASTDEVRLRLVVNPDGTVVEGVDAVVGCRVSSGFRRALAEALPDEVRQRTLLHLLLDDLPGASLVAGYALVRHDPAPFRQGLNLAGVCAGWAEGASFIRAAESTGLIPVPVGPPAPDDVTGDDPHAWHEMAPLPPGGMRRRRRLDLHGDRVDAHFRDSHHDTVGELVVHEYGLSATVDREARRLEDVVAVALVLPWAECPGAVAHAGRVDGVPLAGLHDVVRRELVGEVSCTHLNDMLRSLGDLEALVDVSP
jgi:hypothetical protein